MEIHVHSNSWARGHVDPWWSLEELNLPYVNEPFNDKEALQEWQKLGFTQSRFTGDLYDMRATEPAWIAPFRKVFPLQNFSWSIYRMGPGTVLPEHSDTYAKFKEIYRIKNQTIMRSIVFLQDWASGHYLEMNGEPIVKWRAGDWVIWSDQFPHLAANMGKTDRYTLQITGT
jgi:hypothetical protein